jgi:hypothetical protein
MAGGSTIIVTVDSVVRNPQLGKISAAFTLLSSELISGTTYLIDSGLANGATLTMTPNVYNVLSSYSVTRLESSNANTNTNIAIKFKSTNPVPSGAIFTIQIPDDQFILSGALSSL